MATFEFITSGTLASNATTFTVTSIPSTYQHLCFKWRLRSDVAGLGDGWKIQINGSDILSTSTSSRIGAYASSTSSASLSASAEANNALSTGNNWGSGHYSAVDMWITNYTSSSASDKITLVRSHWGGVPTSSLGNLYTQGTNLVPTSSTITSVGLRYPDSGGTNMLAGSKVWVYGIKTS